MAATEDKKGKSGKLGSALGTSDESSSNVDVQASGLETSEDDEGIESMKTDHPPAQSESSDAAESKASSCLTLPQSDVEEDSDIRDLFITVDNPEKHTTTLESYITYLISTKTTRADFGNCEYSVRRRFNDFLWLRQQLEVRYPTHLVPPLPEKQSLTRLDRFNLDFVRTRQKALRKFLTRLVDHPVLSFDKQFCVFLTANASEFRLHRKGGKGMLWEVTDSIYNMGVSYMMKNRPLEFSLMYEYVNMFGDKMGVLDRITTRILQEQTDYLSELCQWAPCYTLWANCEDQLKASVLSMDTAIDQCCRYFKELTDQTEDRMCRPLKEFVLYTDCIKAVLRRRDAIQMECDKLLDELNKKKDEREQVKISDQTYSFGSFLGKDPQEVKIHKFEKVEQQVSELSKRDQALSDRLEVANADLKSDMERWRKNQRQEVREMLIDMADRQIQFYVQCLSAWEDAIRGIQRKDDDDAEDGEETVHFSRTVRSRMAESSAVASAIPAKREGGVSAVSVSAEQEGGVSAVSTPQDLPPSSAGDSDDSGGASATTAAAS